MFIKLKIVVTLFCIDRSVQCQNFISWFVSFVIQKNILQPSLCVWH